jgi:hypothetical protein
LIYFRKLLILLGLGSCSPALQFGSLLALQVCIRGPKNKFDRRGAKQMSIQKKSLISTLKSAKKAQIASAPLADASDVKGTQGVKMRKAVRAVRAVKAVRLAKRMKLS